MMATPEPLLAKFALGYLAVLAAPGPNMLATGSLAALHGFRGVLPFCLGVATGAGTLAFALHLAFGMVQDTAALESGARAIGGALLLLVALRVVRARRPAVTDGAAPRAAPLDPSCPDCTRVQPFVSPAIHAPTMPAFGVHSQGDRGLEDDAAAFAMGFGTAATNPVTGTYFLAQFLGPLGQAGATLAVVPLTALQALCFGLLVASVFARPEARRLALAHHRAVCVAAGGALAVLALLMLRPLWGV